MKELKSTNMKNMSVKNGLVIIFLGISLTLYSQAPVATGDTLTDPANHLTWKLSKALKFSSAQYQQVLQITRDYQNQLEQLDAYIKKISAKNIPDEQAREKQAEIDKEHLQKLSEVLTQSQMLSYKKIFPQN